MAGPVENAIGLEGGEISIMVCGKTGIGKSTLLNVLLGTENRFVVKGPDNDGDDCMEAGTKDVTSISETIHGIKVTMYDTPGIQSDSCDNYFVDSMAKLKNKMDLVLFCIDSTATRWATETDAVKKLHSCFGSEIWTKAIFVLTRSNLSQHVFVEDEQLSQEEKVAQCQKVTNNIFKRFKDQLLKLDVSAAVVESIPLLAAGSRNKRKLLFVAPEVHNEDFLPELWSLAVSQCRVETKVLFSVVSNYKQSRFIPKNYIASLPPELQDQIKKIIAEVDHSASSPLSLETDGKTQSPPIVLSQRQSDRVYGSLMLVSWLSAAVGSVVSDIAAGAAVGSSAYLTTAVAVGGVGAAVSVLGAAVFVGLGVYSFGHGLGLW